MWKLVFRLMGREWRLKASVAGAKNAIGSGRTATGERTARLPIVRQRGRRARFTHSLLRLRPSSQEKTGNEGKYTVPLLESCKMSCNLLKKTEYADWVCGNY